MNFNKLKYNFKLSNQLHSSFQPAISRCRCKFKPIYGASHLRLLECATLSRAVLAPFAQSHRHLSTRPNKFGLCSRCRCSFTPSPFVISIVISNYFYNIKENFGKVFLKILSNIIIISYCPKYLSLNKFNGKIFGQKYETK